LPHWSSEDCLVGLDLLSVFPETDEKIASISVSPDHSRNAHFAFCIGGDSGHYAGCAIHCCETCLTFERGYMQIASTAPDGCQHLGIILGVRTEDSLPGGFLLVTEGCSCHCVITDCILEMGLPVDAHHGKICAESV
jgi:hypothetical protein